MLFRLGRSHGVRSGRAMLSIPSDSARTLRRVLRRRWRRVRSSFSSGACWPHTKLDCKSMVLKPVSGTVCVLMAHGESSGQNVQEALLKGWHMLLRRFLPKRLPEGAVQQGFLNRKSRRNIRTGCGLQDLSS
eukprot:2321389-Amphidinium_carterae.1